MSKSIAALHVAKKALGLDDDSYRDALRQVTGKSSSADMSEAERAKVLERFRELGFKAGSTGGRKRLEGRFAGKLQALWIAGWNLGLVRDRDDRALLSFVRRQTGIEHVRFLRHGEDAMKAIEALKGWLARGAGVDWKAGDTPAGCIIMAQLELLGPEDGRLPEQRLDDVATMNLLGERIRARGINGKAKTRTDRESAT
jgi:hypothetical protein